MADTNKVITEYQAYQFTDSDREGDMKCIPYKRLSQFGLSLIPSAPSYSNNKEVLYKHVVYNELTNLGFGLHTKRTDYSDYEFDNYCNVTSRVLNPGMTTDPFYNLIPTHSGTIFKYTRGYSAYIAGPRRYMSQGDRYAPYHISNLVLSNKSDDYIYVDLVMDLYSSYATPQYWIGRQAYEMGSGDATFEISVGSSQTRYAFKMSYTLSLGDLPTRNAEIWIGLDFS